MSKYGYKRSNSMAFGFLKFWKRRAAPLQPNEFSKVLMATAHVQNELGEASKSLNEKKKPDKERLEGALNHLISAQSYDESAVVSSHNIWNWLSNAPPEALNPTDHYMLLLFGKEPPVQIKRYMGTVRLALQNCDSTGYLRGEAWKVIILNLHRRLIHDVGFLYRHLLTEQHYLQQTGELRISSAYRTPLFTH